MTKYVIIKENGDVLEYAPRDIPEFQTGGWTRPTYWRRAFCRWKKRRSPVTASAIL